MAWTSQKPLTASSIIEAEYFAASTAVKEIFVVATGCCGYCHSGHRWEWNACRGIPLLIDNHSAIKLIKNSVFHMRTKHWCLLYNFICEK